jgi:PAS domain S-box-containing protein
MDDTRRPTPVSGQDGPATATDEQTRRKALAFDAIYDGVIVTDAEGRVTDWNPAAERMFGYERGTVMGRVVGQVLQLNGPEYRRTGGIVNAVRHEGRWAGELEWVRSDGAGGISESIVLPLYDDSGALVGTVGANRDVTDRKRTEHQLAESERQRREAVALSLVTDEAERTRIAGDLHDDTIQALVASLLSLDRIERALASGCTGQAAEVVRRTRETLGEAAERARRLMFEMRPPLLSARGLAAAIEDSVAQSALDGGFKAAAVVEVERHDEATEALVFRTVSEAVSNVRRHADATEMQVEVVEREGRIDGLVLDNGVGFDMAVALDRSRMRLHLGLEAMGERIRLAGGTLDLWSAPGAGTTVRFSLPVYPS